MIASLDHAMWFHCPFKADDWLMYSLKSSRLESNRGMNHGQIFTRDGKLAVTVMQEGLVRLNADDTVNTKPLMAKL